MANSKREPPKTQRKFATMWAELAYLCRKIHYWWYIRKDKRYAKRYLGQLERVLEEVPDTDMAIIRQEGLAWLHQLKGNRSLAIKHRKQEILLTEGLHESVRQSVSAGDYNEDVASFALTNRDVNKLDEKRAILKALMEEDSAKT